MKGGGKRRRDQDNIFNSRNHMCMSDAYYTLTLRHSPGTQVLKREHLSSLREEAVSKISLQPVQASSVKMLLMSKSRQAASVTVSFLLDLYPHGT